MPEPSTQTENPSNAAEVIAADDQGQRRRKRSLEDRCAVLEDENDKLRGRCTSLEKMIADIAGSLKTKNGSENGKSLWQEIEEFFKW